MSTQPDSSDPTMAFLESLEKPELWHVVTGVPIFVPHKRWEPVLDDKGKPVLDAEGHVKKRLAYEVKEADLPRIAARYEKQVRENGVVPRLTLGHLKSGAKVREEEQPHPVGFSRNLRVGTFGPSKKPCVLADLYVHKEHRKAAQGFPYRSVEYYPGRGEIAGVALLRQDPELDMGLVALEQGEARVLYHRARAQQRTGPDELLVLYSREVNDMPEMDKDPTKPPVADKPDEPKKPLHDEPDGDEWNDQKEEEYRKHCYSHKYAKGYHENMIKKYAMGAAPGAGPAMPGPANGGLPGGLPEKEDKPAMLGRDEPSSRYARLEAEVKAARAESAQLKKNLAEEAHARLKTERRMDLERLKGEGVLLDVDEELADVMDMTPSQYQKQLLKYRTKYERDITQGGAFVRSAEDDRGIDMGVSASRLEEVLAYQRAHGIESWEEAKQKCP